MIHRRTHPNLDKPDCFGCKIATISFATVPGARKDAENRVSGYNKRERDLHAYREARRAGEQPDSTTSEGIEAARRRHETWEKRESDFTAENPPEVVAKTKKAYTNLE